MHANIKFIPSVGLTCKAGSIKCHILGYNCDYTNSTLLELIKKGKMLRRNKLETRINYLKDKWNIVLGQEELDWLYSRKSVVKTHIANILVKRGLEMITYLQWINI
jgi:predicted metal-dependent phosphoesterase TrpH